MEIIDISLTIDHDLPVWPGDPAVQVERFSKLEEGAGANISRIATGVHMGTHVDAPFHFLKDGTTVEKLALDVLIGPALVVAVPESVQWIDEKVIQQLHLPMGTRRVLFKTRNSHYWENGITQFQTDFVAVDESGAKALVEAGIQLVGIDYLSIAPFDLGNPTHVTLLEANVVIVEGLNLAQVTPGEYNLCCLPLKIKGAEGSPARAVLMRRSEY